MSRLALYLLGPPRVYRDGAAVGFDRRKVFALAAWLALNGHPCSRDELSDLLFPGVDRDHARANLRQTISLLGASIGEERLRADRFSVALVSGRGLWVDAADFRWFLESGRSADRRGELDA